MGPEWTLRCIEPLGDGRWVVENLGPAAVLELLADAGVTPLPPYITTPLDDPERYQTTYSRMLGSAAAPTAGLHFTPALDAALAAAGVSLESVTLHVGLGTFKPLPEGPLEAATLHSESFEVAPAVWARLGEARRDGRRIVAVGTTSLRVLEHLALQGATGEVDEPLRGDTRLFIRPGFPFRMVDGLVTNFHLPRTSLLALVMAFCGVDETRAAYRHAVAEQLPLLQLRRRDAGAVNSRRSEACRPARRGSAGPRRADDGGRVRLRGRGARRSRPRRPPDDAARSGRDAVLHARRHQGDRQGGGASRAAGARRPDRPRQHVSPLLPPRHGDRRRARRAPRLHAVGRADPHRFGRVPGLQPRGHARHARRRGGVQLRLRRLASRVHAPAGDAHPGGARRGRHHGVRPVRAGHPAARGARGRRGAHHALGGGLQGGARPPRPAPHRDRAGRRRRGAAAAVGRRDHRRRLRRLRHRRPQRRRARRRDARHGRAHGRAAAGRPPALLHGHRRSRRHRRRRSPAASTSSTACSRRAWRAPGRRSCAAAGG